MDKFYLLIRRYVNATFRLLARAEWSTDAIAAVNEILGRKGGPLTWVPCRAVPCRTHNEPC
jgi:ribosomal RNA-processing protein 1